MLRKFIFILSSILVLTLSGCGGGKLVINSDAVNKVKTIALLKAPAPGYKMVNVGNPFATSLLGFALGGKKTWSSFEEMIAAKEYSFNNNLTAELAAQLQKSGFKVVVIDSGRTENKILEDYSQIDTQGADVVLDIVPQSAGYVTEHYMFSPEWRPESRTFVSMYSLSDENVIYNETVMYGYHNPIMSGTDLDASAEFMFETKDAMLEQSEDVLLAGLDDAVKSIASHVAGRLRNKDH